METIVGWNKRADAAGARLVDPDRGVETRRLAPFGPCEVHGCEPVRGAPCCSIVVPVKSCYGVASGSCRANERTSREAR